MTSSTALAPSPAWWAQAQAELAAADPVMAGLIESYPDGVLSSRGDAYTTLVRSVVGQQISVKAAASVWQRLEQRASAESNDGDQGLIVTPAAMARLSAEALAACGLSRRKVEYLQGITEQFTSGAADPRAWHHWGDEEVINTLVAWRGIGRWTAEMFLIFHQLRPDVLPLADIGLLRGVSKAYFQGEPTTAAQVKALAESWKPWRTAATWYLWRSLDPIPVAY